MLETMGEIPAWMRLALSFCDPGRALPGDGDGMPLAVPFSFPQEMPFMER